MSTLTERDVHLFHLSRITSSSNDPSSSYTNDLAENSSRKAKRSSGSRKSFKSTKTAEIHLSQTEKQVMNELNGNTSNSSHATNHSEPIPTPNFFTITPQATSDVPPHPSTSRQPISELEMHRYHLSKLQSQFNPNPAPTKSKSKPKAKPKNRPSLPNPTSSYPSPSSSSDFTRPSRKSFPLPPSPETSNEPPTPAIQIWQISPKKRINLCLPSPSPEILLPPSSTSLYSLAHSSPPSNSRVNGELLERDRKSDSSGESDYDGGDVVRATGQRKENTRKRGRSSSSTTSASGVIPSSPLLEMLPDDGDGSNPKRTKSSVKKAKPPQSKTSQLDSSNADLGEVTAKREKKHKKKGSKMIEPASNQSTQISSGLGLTGTAVNDIGTPGSVKTGKKRKAPTWVTQTPVPLLDPEKGVKGSSISESFIKSLKRGLIG